MGFSGPFLLSFHFLQFSWAYYFILWGFLSLFAFSQAIYYFSGLVDHYSYHSGPIVFILLLSFSTFFISLSFFCHSTVLLKMGINKGPKWKQLQILIKGQKYNLIKILKLNFTQIYNLRISYVDFPWLDNKLTSKIMLNLDTLKSLCSKFHEIFFFFFFMQRGNLI